MSETTTAVLDVIEGQLDGIEDQIDGVVDVVEIVHNNPKVLTAVSIVSLLAGGAAGYFYAKKQLTSWYEETATREIGEAKLFYANLNRANVDGTPRTPQDVMKDLHGEEEAASALRTYQGTPDEEGPHHASAEEEAEEDALLAKTQEAARTRKNGEYTPYGDAAGHTSATEEDIEELKDRSDKINVFADVTFDLVEESKFRTAEKPYIITHDEFFAAERDYDTVELTYFEMDNTLINEQQIPIEDIDGTMGDDHLVRFGAGSKDKNILYVRNDKLQVDYAITRSKGSYLEEVLGMPEEEPGTLKHSNRETQQRRRREFRHGDG